MAGPETEQMLVQYKYGNIPRETINVDLRCRLRDVSEAPNSYLLTGVPPSLDNDKYHLLLGHFDIEFGLDTWLSSSV